MRVFLSGLVLTVLFGYLIFFIVSRNADANTVQRLSIQAIATQVTSDLDRAMPMINEAGYDMNAISIKSSLPPLVIASFTLHESVPFNKQEMILKALEGNMIGKLALQSLIQAFELDEMLEIEDKDLKTIRLFLTIPPAVQVEYR